MSENMEEFFEQENKTGRYFRVTANINFDAINSNITNIRSIIDKDTKIMAIIKADGYGHGAVPVAKFLNSIDVDAYGIAIIEEGIELRKAGIEKSLLILGYTPVEQYKQLVEYNITQTIFQLETAKALSIEAVKQNKVAKIHLKIDTGMNRIGFSDTKENINKIKEISRMEGVYIEGIFSHFACADEYDKLSALEQLDRFIKFTQDLEEEGINIPIKHISNSAGIVEFPNYNFNMVRSGIITYGYYPSEEVNKDSIKLEPAMEIKTHVSFVKEVGAGEGISYGHTYVTDRKTTIATVPVGYADGYPRSLSSKGRVLIHGEYANIIGRICMDQFMVDVTHIENVKQGDIVTLVGKDKDRFISVEEVSNLAGSFNYEFICNVSKRVPRLYFREGKIVEIKE